MAICTSYVEPGQGRIAAVTSGTRPTGVFVWEGRWIWETDTDRTLVYDGVGWIIVNEPAQAYTPLFTNLTLGNGSLIANYKREDGFCDIEFSLTFGSTTTVAGLIGISTPTSAGVAIANAAMSSVSAGIISMQGYIRDVSPGVSYTITGIPGTTTRVDLFSFNAASVASAATLDTGAASPVATAWATGDTIIFGMRYRMASRYI